MSTVQQIQATDSPEMIAILLICMLFKAGGQVTFSLGEIADIQKQFPQIRMALRQHEDPRQEQLTITLRSDIAENDRASTYQQEV